MNKVAIASRAATAASALSVLIWWIVNTSLVSLSVVLLDSTCHAHLLLLLEHLYASIKTLNCGVFEVLV